MKLIEEERSFSFKHSYSFKKYATISFNNRKYSENRRPVNIDQKCNYTITEPKIKCVWKLISLYVKQKEKNGPLIDNIWFLVIDIFYDI